MKYPPPDRSIFLINSVHYITNKYVEILNLKIYIFFFFLLLEDGIFLPYFDCSLVLYINQII